MPFSNSRNINSVLNCKEFNQLWYTMLNHVHPSMDTVKIWPGFFLSTTELFFEGHNFTKEPNQQNILM